MQSTGNDAFAIDYGGLQPENLTAVFSDTHTANCDVRGPRVQRLRPVLPLLLDQHRQGHGSARFARQWPLPLIGSPSARTRVATSSATSLTASSSRTSAGLCPDRPVGRLISSAEQAIPDNGDPVAAAALLAASGDPTPTLTWDYATSPTADKNAAIVKSSLEAAGFKVTHQPASTRRTTTPSSSIHRLQDEASVPAVGVLTGRTPSTVIPPLFTDDGWFQPVARRATRTVESRTGTSRSRRPRRTTDRATQATEWQTLNKLAMQNMFAIPTFFGLAQDIGGTNVGNLYRWPAYGSWPYAQLYVKGS